MFSRPLRISQKRVLGLSVASFFMLYSYKASEARRFALFQGVNEEFLPHRQMPPAKKKEGHSNRRKIRHFIRLSIRFIHLLFIFFPAVLCAPVLFISLDKYLDVLVFCIERAGAVFIKVAQYVSHRRDMINNELATKFLHLRENAPSHPFEATKKMFFQEFGVQINEVFGNFDSKPIASGSIAQVYKANYKGKDVAVKVRHPHVAEIIEDDLNLIFFITNALAKMFSTLAWMELPVTVNEYKRVLLDQTDLRIEAENLALFNSRFKSIRQICFPKVIPGFMSPKVLVETFEDAKPIAYYIENPNDLNPELARIGMMTFNRMLFFDNFIHADCHAGNLLVRIKSVSKATDSLIWKFQDNVYNSIQNLADYGLFYYERILETIFTTKNSKYASEAKSLRIFKKRNYNEQIQMVLLDVGMVTILNDCDRKNFLKLIKYVIYRDSERCMKLMRELSQYRDEEMSEKTEMSFNYYMKKLFEELNNVPIHKINVGLVLQELLSIVRSHQMKLEGHFATLLTNLIVLEGLAKDLDPDINIVGSTTPFLLNSTIEVLTS